MPKNLPKAVNAAASRKRYLGRTTLQDWRYRTYLKEPRVLSLEEAKNRLTLELRKKGILKDG